MLYLFKKGDVDFFFSWFLIIITFARQFESRDAIWVSKCTEYQSYWVLINASSICLGFVIDLPDTGFWDKDLSYSSFYFLQTETYFFQIKTMFLCKTSGRQPQYIPWRRLEDMSWIRLSKVTFSYLQEILKKYWRWTSTLKHVQSTMVVYFINAISLFKML